LDNSLSSKIIEKKNKKKLLQNKEFYQKLFKRENFLKETIQNKSKGL
jgi:hypothetical protein